jgi:D-sedoheptulose 7-phosphate isomerase
MSLFLKNLAELNKALARIEDLDTDVRLAGELAAQSIRNGGKILFCGNGGSAADSQHLSAELTGRLVKERRPLAALALTTDTSALTSIGNDYSFEEIFSRQLAGLGQAKDLLVAISTSGSSENVVRAVYTAHKVGMKTIGLLGHNGGKLKSLCSHSIIVPSQVTARIQECHILIGHTLIEIIEQELGLHDCHE